MRIYRTIASVAFSVMFILAGVVHLVLGRLIPEQYAAFGETALFDWLTVLWREVVMEHIGVLTILLAVFQIACGLGLAFRRIRRVAAWGILAFLVFITIVGYGLPAASPLEDFLTNRLTTIVMALLVLPLTFRSPRV